jgi:hypothetical protein
MNGRMSPTTRRRALYVGAGVAALLLCAFAYLWLTRPRPLPMGRELSVALTLRAAAQLYSAQHAGCPTIEQVRRGMVGVKLQTSDRWGTPFRLDCRRDGDFLVTSAGADRRFGTTDDLDTDNEGPWPEP